MTNTSFRAVRTADVVVLSSPEYHNGVSGMLKNVLDYLEDTNKDERVYLDLAFFRNPRFSVGTLAVSAAFFAPASPPDTGASR